jgi:hypothetical protein
MIETKGDTTIIRPTPGKWFTGAAIFLGLGVIVPSAALVFLLIALGFGAMASGKMTRLELSPQGLKSVKMGQARTYRWDDVEDFKIVSIRTSLFSSTKMLAFTRKDKKDTFMGKASKFFGGGTESVPFPGISPAQLSASIAGYQTRHMMFAKQGHQARDFGSTVPANPPKPQKQKGAIGFGRPDTSSTSQAAPEHAQTARPRPLSQAPAKPVFGRQSPSTPIRRAKPQAPKPTPRTKPKSDPLVEEGGWMRKRRDGTGF